MSGLAITPFELPLARPLRSAAGTIEARRGFVVRYGDGVGEATPLAPWTEPYAETRAALEAAVDAGWPLSRALAELDATPAARHGVALAALDHHARRRSAPLYRHLGGRDERDGVHVNATLDGDDPAAVADAGAAAVEAGFTTVKLKVGGADPSTDIDRIDALRGAIGRTTLLRLDANAAWDHETAVAVAGRLAPYRPSYLEQPTPGVDHATIDALAAVGVPVALDEAVATHGLGRALASGAAAVVLKPMALGGPDRARAAALAVRACNRTPVLSDLVTGAVGRTAAAHVAASLPAMAPAGLATGDRLARDLVDRPPAVEGGRYRLPDGPGHGLAGVSAGG